MREVKREMVDVDVDRVVETPGVAYHRPASYHPEIAACNTARGENVPVEDATGRPCKHSGCFGPSYNQYPKSD